MVFNGIKSRFSKRFDDYPPPEGKAGEMSCACSQGTPEEAPYFHRLQHDLANSYYWSGSCMQDYIFFVKQWHPFLGMFLCHPNHPWSKKERLLMFLASLAITMVPSAAIAASSSEHKTLLTVLFVTVPDTLSGVILYQLSIAETRGYCHILAPCITVLSSMVIVFILGSGCVSTMICYWLLRHETGNHWLKMMKPLVEGKVISYGTWFPLWLLLPCQLGFLSLWCSERKQRNEGDNNNNNKKNDSAPALAIAAASAKEGSRSRAAPRTRKAAVAAGNECSHAGVGEGQKAAAVFVA